MRKSPIVAGLALIVVGLALYFLRDSMETRVLMFLLMGSAFIAAFLYERAYGFLVPGGIMLGLGVGLMAEDWSWFPIAQPPPFGLGLGFLLIYVLDSLITREGGWWPLIPGGVLVLVGIDLQREFLRWAFNDGWPLAIVALGLFLVLRGLLAKSKGDESPPRAGASASGQAVEPPESAEPVDQA
jgi:hypothetical protein